MVRQQVLFRTFRGRWLLLVILTVLSGLVLAVPGTAKTLAGIGASSDLGRASKAHVLAGIIVKEHRVGRSCRDKREGATAAKRRACQRKQRRLREARRRQAASDAVNQLNGIVDPAPASDPPPDQDVGRPSVNPPDSPDGSPPGVTPRCDLVEGDCSIYSDEFWELQARYEPFELETGVYPMPPTCMEAAAEGKPIGCAQVITYLYPDGAVGSSPWVVDPSAPGGWRFWAPEDPPPGVAPRCELVPGDCSIYSDEFWELQAKYERFEIATGVYPIPPACMEVGGFCIQMIYYLYPDGTLDGQPWIVDPCAPKGWRFWEPDPPSC